MMRPVFEFPSTITSLEEDLATLRATTIYPNPAQNQIWLQGEAEALALYSMSGKLLLQQPLTRSSNQQIQLPLLQDGLYIVKLQKGDAVVSHKLVIQSN